MHMRGEFTPTDYFNLSQITMRGPDAADFLERMSSCSIPSLTTGNGSVGFFLDPSGFNQSYFFLWRLSLDHFEFLVPDTKTRSAATACLAYIDRFHFGERFELKQNLAFTPHYDFSDHQQKPWTRSGDSFFFPDDFFGDPLTVTGSAPPTTNKLLTEHDLHHARVLNLFPWFGFEITDKVNPLEVGFSGHFLKKQACYPGQEVMERTLSKGSPARRLSLLEFSNELPRSLQPQSPQSLFDATQQSVIGETTSISTHFGNSYALALVKKIHAKEGSVVYAFGHEAKITKISEFTRE